MDFLYIDYPIEDVRRLGNYGGNKHKDRTLIVKTTSKHHRRLILLLLHKLITYLKQVYMSKELSRDDQKIENKALKQRRKMIENKYDKNVYELETSNFSETKTKLEKKIWTTGQMCPQNQNNDYIRKVRSAF